MPIAALAVVLLIILGVSVAVAFGLGALLYFLLLQGDPAQVPSVAFRTLDSFTFLAIPFFLLAGAIMQSGGVSRRLVDFVGMLVGRLKGGLGATVVGACGLFGAISGSSIATVSSIGRIMAPDMVQRGYPRAFVGSLTAVSGILGIILPPSVPMIVYAVAAGVSIADMFLGGVVVGIILLVFMLVNTLLWARNKDLDDRGLKFATPEQMDAKRRHPAKRTLAAVPALLMPLIILGGIYSGAFTATESGAIACLYGLLVGLLVYRELRPKKLGRTFVDGVLATAPILLIIAMGGAFARAVVLSGVPADLVRIFASIDMPTWVFLIVLNIALLVIGMFIEENTAIVILTPLLLPVVTSYGVDPLQFGMIMVLNLGMGLATPPFAPNLFVAQSATGAKFHTMIVPALRLLTLGVLPVLIVVNAFPVLTTFMR